MTPIARGGFEAAGSPVISAFNQEFVNFATYMNANHGSLGVDMVIDMTQIAALNAGNYATVTASWQSEPGLSRGL